jgi:hypothetical protein
MDRELDRSSRKQVRERYYRSQSSFMQKKAENRGARAIVSDAVDEAVPNFTSSSSSINLRLYLFRLVSRFLSCSRIEEKVALVGKKFLEHIYLCRIKSVISI